MGRAAARVALLCGAALTAVPGAAAQRERPATPPPVLLIENVAVVDVIGGTLVPGQRVVIRGDTIAAVDPVSTPAPAATRTIDGTGLVVIPGLVDHHVHLTPGSDSALARAVRGGVTLVQAMAGDNRTAGELSRAIAAGERPGPEIAYASVMAGPGFFTDPRFIGASEGFTPGQAPWMQAVTAATDPVAAVAAARGSGAEVLKLYAMIDGGLAAALVREAHRQGMRVVAHGTVFPARPSDLVAAGVDLLTHAPYLSWEGLPAVPAADAWNRRLGPYRTVAPDGGAISSLVRQMQAAGTALEPTLWVFHRDTADSLLQRWAREVTGRAHAAGVPILAGTDGLIDRDPSALPNIHRELALLVEAGLSPAAALAAATIVPARFMGRGETHGVVAPGRVADLVLLEANPLADIAATTRIRAVIRRGIPVLASPTPP